MEARCFGQISHGLARRRDWSLSPLRRRLCNCGTYWRALSSRYSGHQRFRLVSHRPVDDIIYGTPSTSPELAAFSDRWISWRVHDILKFRVRDVPGGTRWGEVDWAAERRRQRGTGIHRGLDRCCDCRPAIDSYSGSNENFV